ncbi:SusC/RagA family TonB-linked outer membrane protein [Sphingobacterium haloxyli]|uniref:SusC/RagA family TonB-linked outer membrane protein n=1 Tax=Sphingobacterium haloxyli TaxID=2100533 RepID=A0A2S9J311_9SPHI|nr:TonB-dependent receptor [Sphingobacterium haloxyli]PRD47152.1 SusC/RagA family TonB-linked outer membrane protein [Sphingobacterium haloxyli]
MRKLCILFLFLASTLSYGYAQVKTVTGTVKDSQSLIGLPGVTISKPDGTGTQTDAAGRFSVEVGPADSLTFRFIGYTPQSVMVGDQETLDVFLISEDQALEEVVVIGYGTQKKADLTGSISSLGADEIIKQPAMSAMQSVQGKAAGLNIVASEAPGSAPNVIIRGLGTALGGRNPLYIVDGMPVADINNINPADIESMDVLKDASSASIYGLRAANGVIIITTKRGKAGFFQISYDSYSGIKNVLNRVKMANGNQFATYVNEHLSALGQDYSIAENGQHYETDWYDEILKAGTVFNNAVNLSGGSENIDYYLSFNNFTENGIIDGNKFVRNTIRNNNTYKFLDERLKFHQTLNLTFTDNDIKPNGAFNSAYRQTPITPVWYENGRAGRPILNGATGLMDYTGSESHVLNSIGNPVYDIMMHNEMQKSTTIQGGFEGEFQITDYLKINSRVGATKYYFRGRNFTDTRTNWLNGHPTRTEAEFEQFRSDNPESASYAYNRLGVQQEETFRWVWENFLTFQKSFGAHNLEAILGMSRERFGAGNRMEGVGYDLPEKEQYWSINLANSAPNSPYPRTINHRRFTPRALASYFGRVQYNYDSRYYFTATIRRDGTSAFRESGNYWGTFPSFGAAWTLSNEPFMADATWVDFLKIRTNWGMLGNQDIPLNVSQIITSPGTDGGAAENTSNYVFGPSQELVYGAAFGTPVLPVGWEITHETGVGLDFGFLNNNLTGSIDYYHKLNTNVILNVVPTLSSPFQQNFYAHGGKVLNQGIEMVVNWNKAINENFSYNIGANYAYNENEVTEVEPAYDRAIGGSLANGQITKQLRVGQPIYGWWMWEADGVWQNEQEIAENAKYGDPIPGHLRYKDQDGDGAIDNRDKVFFGSYLPTSTYGINLGVNYKAIDFSIYGYGVAGNMIYNALKGTRIDGGENIAEQTFKERWTGNGSTNIHPGAARDSYASSYYLESGSYFRINNITLGYTFERLYSNSSNLRVYLSAQNPFMFTKYSGFSPEIATDDGAPSATTGIELSAYPTTRNFLFGLSLQF